MSTENDQRKCISDLTADSSAGIQDSGTQPKFSRVLCQTLILGSVIPAEAGIQCRNLDSRPRGNDKQTLFSVLKKH
jgi:hypothetical protein